MVHGDVKIFPAIWSCRFAALRGTGTVALESVRAAFLTSITRLPHTTSNRAASLLGVVARHGLNLSRLSTSRVRGRVAGRTLVEQTTSAEQAKTALYEAESARKVRHNPRGGGVGEAGASSRRPSNPKRSRCGFSLPALSTRAPASSRTK